MDDFYTDGPPESDWEDRGDLAWNEFDWERYLREQDEVIHRYLGFYEAFRLKPDRIDLVAEQMGWETSVPNDEPAADEAAPSAGEDGPELIGDDDVYTLHKHPVFVATRAICLSLTRSWELIASDSGKVPAPIGLSYFASLHRTEDQAVQAIHALDFGDYAMAISVFKRALSALNQSLALLNGESAARHQAIMEYRKDALPRLFDLREIWLRVISECREELSRPIDGEN